MDKCHLKSSKNRAGARTGRAILDLPGAYYGLTSIEDIDLIGISSPGSNGTVSAPGPNQPPMPEYTHCTKSIAKTDGTRGNIQNQPLQLSSNAQIRPEHESHLVVQGGNCTDVDSQSTPSFDYDSASHLAFKDRPQLYDWLKETSNSKITVTERLEKFNWELYESQTPPIAAAGCLLRELDILASL